MSYRPAPTRLLRLGRVVRPGPPRTYGPAPSSSSSRAPIALHR
jgi:hypothetical protein